MKKPSIDRVRQVVADLFGVEVAEVLESSSPDTIKAWDSVGHINLVLAIESEFSVALSPEDSQDMLTVGLIARVLGEKGLT